MQLHYFVSPMCSWCWGFAPVIQQIHENYSSQLDLRIVLTPFRIENNQVMDKKLRSYVLDQWHKVHASTGQEFDFNFTVKENFIYNTLLACKVIKTFALQYPKNELLFLHAVQKAFYRQNIDITDEANLIEIASNYKINLNRFKNDLYSDQIKKALDEDFKFCQQSGINSYPTLLLEKQTEMTILANGYVPYPKLEIELRKYLATQN